MLSFIEAVSFIEVVSFVEVVLFRLFVDRGRWECDGGNTLGGIISVIGEDLVELWYDWRWEEEETFSALSRIALLRFLKLNTKCILTNGNATSRNKRQLARESVIAANLDCS